MYITFFWGVVLLLSKNQCKAKFLLGIFMMTAFLLYLSHAIFFQKNPIIYQYFHAIYIFSTLAVYPLYYWYIRLLTTDTTYRLKNLQLLAPAFILSAASFIIHLFMNSHEKSGYLQSILMQQKTELPDTFLVQLQNLVYTLVRIIFVGQVIIYLISGRRLLEKYNNQLSNFYSNLEKKSIFWVNIFLYSILVTALMSITFNIIGRSLFLESKLLLSIPSLIFSILLFLIGYLGFIQNHTISDFESDNRIIVVPIKKYTNAQLANKLIQYFQEDQPYKDPELVITEVAHYLGTNRTYLSELINTDFACSFVEFVNKYRLKEAKRLMSVVLPDPLTLKEIAEHSGFGSQGTFIRIFRNHEGITPGKYREIREKNKVSVSENAQQVAEKITAD